jgi:glucose/arabinose dehydrogenase/mono/diheme cytochrome c family protein
MKFLYLNIFLFTLLLVYLAAGDIHRGEKTFSMAEINRQHVFQSANVETRVIADSLDIPWEILWGPDDKIWVTEQKGSVSQIDPQTGEKKRLLQLKDVWFLRTAGLLGMAIHPDIRKMPFVYLNYTFLRNEKPFSRLVRYTWHKDSLVSPRVLMEIPANNGHSGSRLSIWKGKLFWATGDAASTTFAQDFGSPNGKILRLNLDGSIPSDNPVKGSPVWAMGFRNIQGMVFTNAGKLYTSEHGDATDDEINLVESMKNYGWPAVQGFAESPEEKSFAKSKATTDPLKAWTPTIAPAGLDYYSSGNITSWNNSLLLVSLKGKSLRVMKLDAAEGRVINEEVFFENEFGRLRDICISPAGDVYISTSNRDWNRTMGEPSANDDRIIRITHSDKPSDATMSTIRKTPAAGNLYQQYCAACHKPDGSGLAGIFPPIKGSGLVKTGGPLLISKIMKGSAGTAVGNGVRYDAQMPSFSFLKDEELMDIIRYVRSLNGLDSPGINSESIRKIRGN